MSILKLIKWFLGKHYYINAVLPPMFPDYTKLAGSYDKNNICTKKIVVGICSVHRDISSKTNNLIFLKFLLSKKLILELGSILA